jgi:hypothetical protein
VYDGDMPNDNKTIKSDLSKKYFNDHLK